MLLTNGSNTTEKTIIGGRSFDNVPLPPQLDIYDDGFLRVEHENYHVACAGDPVKLARTEFLIVSLLVRKVERFVPPEVIWEYLWKKTKPLNLDSLHVLIYRLRRRFEPHGIEIETMVNVGYKLIPAKTVQQQQPPPSQQPSAPPPRQSTRRKKVIRKTV